MNDIFSKDLNGEMVSPDEPGYDALIDDIFRTMETAQELATYATRSVYMNLWERFSAKSYLKAQQYYLRFILITASL